MHEKAGRLVDRYNDTPGYAARLADLGHIHGVPDEVVAAEPHSVRHRSLQSEEGGRFWLLRNRVLVVQVPSAEAVAPRPKYRRDPSPESEGRDSGSEVFTAATSDW